MTRAALLFALLALGPATGCTAGGDPMAPCEQEEVTVVSLTTSADQIVANYEANGFDCALTRLEDVPIPLGLGLVVIVQQKTYLCTRCF